MNRHPQITEDEKKIKNILGPYRVGTTSYTNKPETISEAGTIVTAIETHYYILPNGSYRTEETQREIRIFPPILKATPML